MFVYPHQFFLHRRNVDEGKAGNERIYIYVTHYVPVRIIERISIPIIFANLSLHQRDVTFVIREGLTISGLKRDSLNMTDQDSNLSR